MAATTTSTAADKLAQREADGTRTGSKAGANSKSKGTGKAAGRQGAKPRSTKDAVEKVLRDAAGPMPIRDIAAKVIGGKLAPGLKGKTPEATIGAQVAVDAKAKGRFVKTEPGIFDLRELNPRGAKTRPKAKTQPAKTEPAKSGEGS